MHETKVVFSIDSKIKSPTFIATADIHLGKKLYNVPELEEDLKDNLVRLADLAMVKKVDYLVIAGDLFENNQTVKPHTIAFVSNIVEKLRGCGIRTVGIAGDHDKPLRGEAWIRIAKVEPVTIEPAFAGLDYFDYSTVTVDELVGLLRYERDTTKVQWLFLHCQFPQLFQLAQPKKLIDFNKLNLFENFPNLLGVIAGDIHVAGETKAYGVGHEAFVGYPGSLGVLDKSEFKHDKHVLYCDGKYLKHLPFPSIRTTRDIQFIGKRADDFDITEHVAWCKSLPVKPLIYVHYTSETENQMHKIVPLYECALIKPQQVTDTGELGLGDTKLSCRSEASTDDKIDKALQVSCEGDEALYQLSSDLLKEDPKDVLDKFKAKFTL